VSAGNLLVCVETQMISPRNLRAIARARLQDAQVLLRSRRFDGAFYLCGYAVELALKARICRTLKWSGFPETAQDFKGLQSFKTHDLEMLLRFSGAEARVKARHLAEWSVVLDWNPEKRYQAIGQSTAQQAADMVTCVRRLLEVL
jgi:HEPN domain-containing protein